MNLPEYTNIRIRTTQDGKHEVLDVLRRRFVALTPEEWVRQHVVNWLVTYLGYPASLMGNEVELRIGNKKLRCDSILYAPNGTPRMIMEYKAESIQLTEKVLTQITTYNMLLHVKFLLVSNGNQHIFLRFDEETQAWTKQSAVPRYSELD